MVNFTEIIKGVMRPRNLIIIAVVIAFLAIAAGVLHIMNRRSATKFQPNAEYYPEGGEGGQVGPSHVGAIKLTMYGVPWCPHSKAAMKPWKEWSKANDGSEMNGVKVECKTVNCEDEEEECTNAGIQGYPTVMAETPNGDRVIMEAKTTIESLGDFMDKVSKSVATGKALA